MEIRLLKALVTLVTFAVSEARLRSSHEAPSAPKVAGQSLVNAALKAELDGVMTFAAKLPGDDVNMDPSSVQKMERAVVDLVTTQQNSAGMAGSVQQIKDLITKTMMPKVKKQSDANQKELDRLALEVESCQAKRSTSGRKADGQKKKYLKASRLHKKCRKREAHLATETRACKSKIKQKTTIKELKCRKVTEYEESWGTQAKNAQVIIKAAAETPRLYMQRLHDTYCSRTGPSVFHKFLSWEKQCKRETLRLTRMQERCKNKKRDYKAKKAECDNIQGQMDGAACNRAVLIKDSCESYAECYQSRRKSYLNSKKVIAAAVTDRKAEWRALQRMLCLIDGFRDGKVSAQAVADCKAKTHDTSHLELNYPRVGKSRSCVVPDRYPATAAYKKIEFAPLPALAKGNVDANECYGVLEISTKPKAGSPRSCKCTRVTLNGPYSSGAMVKCEDCLDVYKSKEKDSCPEGTKIFSPRSRSDWRTLLASAGPLAAPNWIVDITRPKSGCGGCTKYTMNSKEQSSWMTEDGSPWWLRGEGRNKYSEPNGDYDANCYLNLKSGITSEDDVTFNDHNCNYHSRSYYCQQRMISTTPKRGSPEGCNCQRVELTGRYSPGALLKCVGCLDVHRATDKDSCPEGTKLFSPRSREDWNTVLESVGPLRAPNWIVDVTRPSNGCGTGCSKKPMNFEVPEQATWRTQDGSPWWLRSTKYGEPNGDYKANCYMDLWKNPDNEDRITFNDANCKYHSTSYYCQPRTVPR